MSYVPSENNKWERVIYSDLCCDFEQTDWLELAMCALDQANMSARNSAIARKHLATMLGLWDDVSFGDSGVAPQEATNA